MTQAWPGLNTRVLDGFVLVALFVAVWQGLYRVFARRSA